MDVKRFIGFAGIVVKLEQVLKIAFLSGKYLEQQIPGINLISELRTKTTSLQINPSSQ